MKRRHQVGYSILGLTAVMIFALRRATRTSAASAKALLVLTLCLIGLAVYHPSAYAQTTIILPETILPVAGGTIVLPACAPGFNSTEDGFVQGSWSSETTVPGPPPFYIAWQIANPDNFTVEGEAGISCAGALGQYSMSWTICVLGTVGGNTCPISTPNQLVPPHFFFRTPGSAILGVRG